MKVALVTDEYSDYKELCALLKADGNEIVFVNPLKRSTYGLTPEELLEQEKSVVPLYRCDAVIYYSENHWDNLTYTMERAMGGAVIEENDIKYDEVRKLCACCMSKNGIREKMKSFPKHLHWYNRSIYEIKERYRQFGFSTVSLEPYFEEFLGVPMSMERIIKSSFDLCQ